MGGRAPETELERLFGFLAESILEVSDEELLAEVREAGQDPEVVSQQVRSVIEDAIADHARREGL